MSDVEDACGPESVGKVPLRIAAIFVILVTSLLGTMFPILSKRVNVLRRVVPGAVFELCKFFGSGVILATGFIHLLEPSVDALGEGNTLSAGGCIPDSWAAYPYPFALCLASLFATFVSQIVFFRLGTERMHRLVGGRGGARPHIHVVGHPGHVDAPPPPPREERPTSSSSGGSGSDVEKAAAGGTDDKSALERASYTDAMEDNPVAAQLMGVLTLEFGVVLHSVIIGLTLATTSDDEVTTLFIVIVFHQMFEGLGLGSRLAFLRLDDDDDEESGRTVTAARLLPWLGALLYSLCTPVGMAIGLGLREGIAMSSGTASVVSGVLDSVSSGILLYTATVELIAHEFIFNKYYHTCSWSRLWFSLACFALGAGIMALLGKWA
ncbi:ZIP-like iron-zinc transporter [Rhodotorula diobovata]|uniref:ZIP-like iron-zinc transporter n=1 Tax=Rhodotorula diobovata TaxID=5288 RepID=A0A5C5FW12_9BASI|nr:ZIP-like iron-zinc transporter [Rhodotorula diobovata]